MKVTQIVFATGLVGHAAATWNMFGNPFNSPKYNDNECSDKQKGGFNWEDLKDGESNFNYGDFDFTGGWKCSNSFGKRDHLTRRTFGSKCIKNKVSKQKPASFGCDKRKAGFSITHIDVSVEYDVDLELHYHMEDGSKCKQVAPCKSSGSTIQNTQCGGAKSVDVYLPKHDKSDKECEIGFHNIGFDCNPGTGYTPPSPPTPPEIPSSSAPVVSPPASTPVVSEPASSAPPSSTPSCNGDECNSQPPATSSAAPPCDGEYCASSAPVSSAPATETPATSAPPCDGGYCPGSVPVSSGPATEVSSTPEASVPTPPATETPATETPATETTATETPATETPATETPATSGAPPCDGGYCAGSVPVSSAPATEVSTTTPPAETPATSTSEISSPPATETPVTPCGGYGQESCEGTTVISTPVETPSTFSTAPYTNNTVPATTAPPTYETSPVAPPTQESSPVAPPPVPESSSAPACGGSYGESCEGTTAVSTPAASSSAIISTGVPQPSSPSYPPVSPPDVLPKCMNTWLEVSGNCKNNADASCYCKNKDFTKQVIECVSAWCGTDDETREALQYLIGICAEHVPENPGLVTDCPSYIPLNPTPATPTAPAGGVSTPAGEVASSTAAYGTTPAPEVPGTTPAPGTTPIPEVPGSAPAPGAPAETPVAAYPHTTIIYGTTTLTIPQVHFTTQTNEAGATPTEPVGLIPGTAPAQAPASTTPAPYPIAGTTLATFKPSGTGAYSPTSPAEFTGAAAPFKLEAQHAILGAMLAFFAL